MNKLVYILITITLFYAQNPAMEGFNASNSDKKAIEIADKVMEALGGYENWNNTEYISWNFFGRRMHYWNKWTGDYRMEYKNTVVIMNLNNEEAKLYIDGAEETHADSLTKFTKFAKSAWINDSYWMFMPYKLKDSGVSLKYVGEGKTEDGIDSHILQLTFEEVGNTPENKYHVFVNKSSFMVEQWSFFRKFDDEKPRFINPWKNWKKYGNIMLSDSRGKNGHDKIAVFTNFDMKKFNSATPIVFEALNK